MGDFIKGFISGAAVVLIMLFVYGAISCASENSGYSEKLIIEYHNPNKEYDRKLVSAIVDASGVQTNFLNKVYSMDKYRVKVRLTNPE